MKTCLKFTWYILWPTCNGINYKTSRLAPPPIRSRAEKFVNFDVSELYEYQYNDLTSNETINFVKKGTVQSDTDDFPTRRKLHNPKKSFDRQQKQEKTLANRKTFRSSELFQLEKVFEKMYAIYQVECEKTSKDNPIFGDEKMWHNMSVLESTKWGQLEGRYITFFEVGFERKHNYSKLLSFKVFIIL